MLAVYWGFYQKRITGAGLALVAGYLMDMAWGGPVGLNALSKVLVNYFAYVSVRSMFLDSPVFQGGVVFAAIMGEGHLIFLVSGMTGYSSAPYSSILLISSLKGVYTAILTPPIFVGMKRLEAALLFRQGGEASRRPF